jgi:hypothetical protein
LKLRNHIKKGGKKMKKLVSILSVVVFLAAAGVFIFGQNAFAEEPGLRFLVPEDLQEVNPGDKITVSGVVDGVRQLSDENKLSLRVGRHSLPMNSRRNRFTSEFEVSETNQRHRRWSRRHGVIYVWGRVKIDNKYYFDKVKLRVNRSNGHGYGHHGHGYGHHWNWYGKKDND